MNALNMCVLFMTASSIPLTKPTNVLCVLKHLPTWLHWKIISMCIPDKNLISVKDVLQVLQTKLGYWCISRFFTKEPENLKKPVNVNFVENRSKDAKVIEFI
uniref:Uncharacterized protein n=1 Tax=Cacopsylla melanoneura TaxID=428564 RepID=A0A8D8VHE8_9HEMI